MKMDDVRNVPTYLKFETTFGCTFGGLILGFIFPPFWLLTFVGIALLFARLFWEIKHPMTKEQKEQSIIERAKAKEEFRQAKEELGDSLRQARAVKCPHCKSTDVEFMVQQRKSFSIGKAAAGTIMTGGVGALAGFAGKKGKKEWHCKNCGAVFATKK
nr:MAG TPA: 50S ribosomal subunit [Caudoviricetes sp.]